MTNPTSNFGWQMPTSTDLVTDLPADFEVFGQAVDTTLAELKGGTTGQVLSKTTATDMDFTWVTPEIGDITSVVAGTGLSGGGTTGAVTVSINTAVTADLSTAQTMTNKNLSSATNTFPTTLATLTGSQTLTNKTLTAPIISSISNTGTLTLPTATDTLVGRTTTDTLTNKTLTAPIINIAINTNIATTYTFVLADNGKLVTSNNAASQTLSIPTNAVAAFPIGAQINVAWITGVGQPTIQAVTPGTTTIISTGATSSAPKLRVVNAVATCIKIATDIWLVTGDIS